jgi:hypothetical protein
MMLGIMEEHCYAERYLCCVTFMPFMLSVFMQNALTQNVVAPLFAFTDKICAKWISISPKIV